MVVALALRSGIPVREWLDGDIRDVLTAVELYHGEDREGHGGPVMSG
jgi:hypothetical protein